MCRAGDRHYQGGVRLPPVLLARGTGGGWRMVSGLFGFQSQALPYRLLGLTRERRHACSSTPRIIPDGVLPVIVFRSLPLTRAVNNMRAASKSNWQDLCFCSLRQAARRNASCIEAQCHRSLITRSLEGKLSYQLEAHRRKEEFNFLYVTRRV